MTGKNYFLVEFGPPAEAGGVLLVLRGPSLVPDFSISSLGTTSLYHSALTDKTSGTYLSYFPVRYQKKPQKPGLSSNIMTLGTIEEIELNCLVHQILRQRIFTALIGHD